jgi:hypothetical protein
MFLYPLPKTGMAGIVLLLLFAGSLVNAQTVISGRTQDDKNAPVPFATILLLRATDSTLVRGTVSTADGQFRFESVKKGSYIALASAMGYHKTYLSPVTVSEGSTDLDLGVLRMVVEEQQLQAVTVSAYKPMFEQQADRLVIHVHNSITNAGGTALDVLERAPGMSVDRQDNKLSLNGKTSVLVMINGKLNRMPIEALLQQLAGMPTSFIEKVELITNPPARYDAEGDAGLVNIILKKNTSEGFNGTYTVSGGYGYYEKMTAAGMINYRARKLALFGDYSYVFDRMWQEWLFDWQLQPGADTENSRSFTLANRKAVMPVHTARAGFEYNLTPRLTVAGLVSGFDSRWAMDAQTTAWFQHRSQEVKSTVKTDEINHWQHLMGNLSLNYQTDKTEVSLDVDRLYYNNVQPTAYTSTYQQPAAETSSLPSQMAIDKRTPFGMWVMKMDVVRSLSKGWRLETGLKSSMLSLKNTVVTDVLTPTGWQNDSAFSQRTSMSETILAGYVAIKGQWSKRWQVQGGLRSEYTQTLLLADDQRELVNRRYANLFPSVFLTYEIGKQRSLQVSYSRRITRPPYKILAPTMIFIGPTTLRTGNPGILPTLSDAVQLNYRFNGSYLVSVRYTFDKNQFFDYQPQIDRSDTQTTRQIFNTRNIDRTHSVATTISFPWNPTRWWQTQTQLMAVWQHSSTRYESSMLVFRQVYGQLNTTNTFKLWPGGSAELTAFYNTPSQTMGVFKRQAFGSVTVGVQQKLNKQHGVLRATISDLFWTNNRIGWYDIPEQHIYSYTSMIYEPRVFRLSYTHNFGGQSVKNTGNRKTGSEEERERAN